MLRLLIDNDFNQIVATGLLQTLAPGVEIDCAFNGVEVLERLSQKNYDLILMDIHLPGMDGITAFKHLKADPRTSKIPVIAVTASAMPNEREVIEAAGFEGYQSKPISVKKLAAEVSRIIDAHPTPHMTD